MRIVSTIEEAKIDVGKYGMSKVVGGIKFCLKIDGIDSWGWRGDEIGGICAKI